MGGSGSEVATSSPLITGIMPLSTVSSSSWLACFVSSFSSIMPFCSSVLFGGLVGTRFSWDNSGRLVLSWLGTCSSFAGTSSNPSSLVVSGSSGIDCMPSGYDSFESSLCSAGNVFSCTSLSGSSVYDQSEKEIITTRNSRCPSEPGTRLVQNSATYESR